VQIRNVTKRIGRRTIVERLNLDIYPGEVFGFLGPNGAGKTTTIRMMVGLISMTEGDVTYGGISVKKRFREAIAHVGAIVENPELYKYLSGYENLRQYARMAEGVDRARIDEVVRLVGLEDRIGDNVRTYSLGMRQRLGLAQALLHAPSVLILDEPTNGLDPAGIREMRHYLRKLAHEEGMTVMVSSHLLTEMELMCDRFAVMQHGRIRAIESVRGDDSDSGRRETTVTLQAEPLEAARQCISERFPDAGVRVEEGELRATMPQERIPELVSALVGRDLKVYRVQTAAKSLEEKFMELTEGGGLA
jgi:ABC-2 type transport system ATP-binding protein